MPAAALGNFSRNQASARSHALPKVTQVCVVGACVLAWSRECRPVNSPLSLTRGEGPCSLRDVALGRRQGAELPRAAGHPERGGTPFLWREGPRQTRGDGAVCVFGGRAYYYAAPRAALSGADETGGFGPVGPSLRKGTAQAECPFPRPLPRKHLSSCWLATQLLRGSRRPPGTVEVRKAASSPRDRFPSATVH